MEEGFRPTAAMNIHSADLDQGIKFVSVGGAVEVPIGVTRKKVEFILSRGTRREHRVSLCVTVVDTTTYDALLGIEFILQITFLHVLSIPMARGFDTP